MLLAFSSGKDAFANLIRGRRFELSTSASLSNVKHKGDETDTEVNIRLRLGYFLVKGVEIEPELFLNIQEDLRYTGCFFLVNLVQNFKASQKFIPFLLCGAGYGNGAVYYDLVFDQNMGVTALNLGAGVKCLLSDSAALRVEYRLTKYMGERSVTYPWGDTYTYELNRTDNNIMIGMSIFF